jgi:aldehyde:ferredoxin oxidoreductase
MRMAYGRTGKILFIDLHKQRTHTEETDQYRDFIGGRGINHLLLFNSVPTSVAPLDAENVVVLGAGPLVGTLVPAANRLAVEYKNVITGGVGSGNCGGQFAAEMKFAGYDHIVIAGKAATPVYIYVRDAEVFFRDAGDLWGQTTWDTENLIREKERDKAVKTLTIGPGGENLVKFACLIGDRGRAVGYGGAGAIFGGKNLKAFAIRGTKPVRVADPAGLLKKTRDYYAGTIAGSEMVRVHRQGGTLLAYQLPGERRPHGVRNMGDEFWPDASIAAVSRAKVDEGFLQRRHSCFNCPVYCSGIYKVDGLLFEGFQANSFRAFASNLDVTSPAAVLRATALTNLYGLDGDHTSSVIAWAIECFENGLLTAGDTDGLELRWGGGDAVLQLIENIARRRGFGGVLAEGVYEAARTVGRGSEKYSVVVKKNGLMEAAMRSNKAWALGVVTSTKGGGHLRGAIGKDNLAIPAEIAKNLFGIANIGPINSYDGKAAIVAWQEDYKGIIDIMGICALTSVWMDHSLYRPDDIAEFHRYVTGEDIAARELLKAGARLQNLERVFNLLHAGFGRADDMPPEKLVRIAVSAGPYKGEKLDIDKWNAMLDEYYARRRWDKETGWPTRKGLADLDLGFAVEMLEKNNIKL